jgi:methylenetetrahydrofolate--tRNA-(uracil-5-)-methyltransferase
MPKGERVIVIGGGLAGCEAAWQVANMGVKVVLYEMRPYVMTPAHKTGLLAELVCSNSLRSDILTKPAGLLKEEMRRLNSIIIRCADETAIPGGGALTVDREEFARAVTRAIEAHELITVERRLITSIPSEGIVIVATGPLTHHEFAEEIRRLVGEEFLHFYDAVAPIVDAETIDYSKTFMASRYRDDEPAYVNCPMNEEEYNAFWEALVSAERVKLHEFDEEAKFFEGCLPIEVMAERGRLTLVYGPLRPTGLIDPRTGKQPFAVVQLRPENKERTLYNMVGFQTQLKWSEQRRVFRMIPGLEHAEFVRYGMVHRNTFVNAPKLLLPTYQLKVDGRIFFAGQFSGVEGYIESAASGLVAGINAARMVLGMEPLVFPPETALGALANYITTADPRYFQPMNMNFGLLPPLPKRVKDKALRQLELVRRALSSLEHFIDEHGLIRGVPKHKI